MLNWLRSFFDSWNIGDKIILRSDFHNPFENYFYEIVGIKNGWIEYRFRTNDGGSGCHWSDKKWYLRLFYRKIEEKS